MDNESERLRRLFEERVHIDPKQLRRATRTGTWIFVLVILAVFVLASLTPYTEYLWYADDARHPEVFDTNYGTRGSLLLVAFFASWAALYFSLRRALTISLVYLRTPDTPGTVFLSNAMGWVQQQGARVVVLAAPVVALLSALGFSNEWSTYLLASHAQRFGRPDPTFGIDLGFFVFTLPWYRAITNYVFALLLLTTVLTVGFYVGLQALAMLARIELSRPHVRTHIGVLVAATLLAYAAQQWLKTYEIGLVDSGQFTGAGYAMTQAFWAQRVLAVLAAITAVLALIGTRVGKSYRLLAWGGGITVAWFALGLVVWPGIAQRLLVDPNRLDKEAPFAAKALAMTRFSYGLENVETREVASQPDPSAADVVASQITLANMRLWDPLVLRQTLESLQSFRNYYTFNDVDVDRYLLDGRQTMVMLAPRDMSLQGLDPQSQNWTNQRLRYTHGYGVAITRVDSATPDGDPILLAKDVPQDSAPGLKLDEPRIYYSYQHDDFGRPADEYALVRTKEKEFDYETAEGTVSHEWTGDRGIPISGLMTRLAFAMVLGDGNLLVSTNVTGASRLLIHRNVVERASRILPFLKFDQDPYVVVLNGRLLWVLDGYTTSDMVPYAQAMGDGSATLNYIRNSVKVTVDAYSGDVQAYAVEPDEPLLRAYRRIYPGLVRDVSEAPAGLAAHFRYPEDLFQLQTSILAAYHVTDPRVFLSNSDAWNVSRERGPSGEPREIAPYFVEMKLPMGDGQGFFLIRPFSPNGKPNMSGWLAAHCDPDSYGKLTLYRFRGQFPDGAELMESKFSTTPEIANINRQFNNEQSRIIVGNTLVIPIGDSVMYAESLFLRANTEGLQQYPRLTKVILALHDRVVVEDTYEQALKELLATTPPPSSPNPATPGNPTLSTPVPTTGVRQALQILDQADAALRNGDFARYGELQKTLRQKLEQLAK